MTFDDSLLVRQARGARLQEQLDVAAKVWPVEHFGNFGGVLVVLWPNSSCTSLITSSRLTQRHHNPILSTGLAINEHTVPDAPRTAAFGIGVKLLGRPLSHRSQVSQQLLYYEARFARGAVVVPRHVVKRHIPRVAVAGLPAVSALAIRTADSTTRPRVVQAVHGRQSSHCQHCLALGVASCSATPPRV